MKSEPVLVNVIKSKCSLGEGLFISKGIAAWVDINSCKVFIYQNDELIFFKTKSIPSIIYDVNDTHITFGSNIGISSFNINTKEEKLICSGKFIHDIEDYRSNDGGSYGDNKFLSFMHLKRPDITKGFIYRVSGNSYFLQDDSIYIPNTFIKIEDGKMLISDSLKSKIWLYDIDSMGNLCNKRLWYKFESTISPDGGCMVGNLVLVALWDDASVAIFNKDGEILSKLHLPVLRPTNCKYDLIKSQLWITSASEGLDDSELDLYPQSGNTFIYNFDKNLIC